MGTRFQGSEIELLCSNPSLSTLKVQHSSVNDTAQPNCFVKMLRLWKQGQRTATAAAEAAAAGGSSYGNASAVERADAAMALLLVSFQPIP